MANLNTIKAWFKTGLKPTQQQFSDTWDSFWHKDDIIPVGKIENLNNRFNEKADADAFRAHLNDLNAHGIADKIQNLADSMPRIADTEIADNKLWSSEQIVKKIGTSGNINLEDEGQEVILIPHALNRIPSYWNIRAINQNAKNLGIAEESADANHIIIKLVFTNNDSESLQYLWEARI